ncbi:MAG: hypothetical protein RJA44_1121 [Pseudomonadota bacterium]
MNQTILLLGQIDWPENICLARALHDAGWSVEFVTTEGGAAALSRWLHLRQVDAFNSSTMQKLLAETSHRSDVAWILPLDETTIQLCNELAPDDTRLLPRIPAEQRLMLENKSSMSAYAASLGINIPEMMQVDEEQPLLDQASRIGYPLVLKAEVGGGGENVALCADEAALVAAQTRVPPPQRILQRMIQGRPWKAGGFYIDGQPVMRQSFEVIVQAPARTGPPAYVRNDSPTELVESLDRMAASLKWTGYFQIDMIREADGRFYFLEINPRPWSAMIAALPAGTPIFAPLCDYLAGRTAQVNLQQQDGWEGYVFPRPVSVQARELNHWGILRTLCTPAFWRSAPALDRHSLIYMAKHIYWDWSKARRQAGQSARLAPQHQ